MKRFHVHLAVNDLAESIGFYSALFGQAPTRQRSDYAKWMLDDPRINFAISARGHAAGVNHVGIQVDSADELATIRQLAQQAAGDSVLDQSDAACCYAQSEKHWTVDPQGLAWEHFYTMAESIEFGSETAAPGGACCVPVRRSPEDQAQASAECCIPNADSSHPAAGSGCCA